MVEILLFGAAGLSTFVICISILAFLDDDIGGPFVAGVLVTLCTVLLWLGAVTVSNQADQLEALTQPDTLTQDTLP